MIKQLIFIILNLALIYGLYLLGYKAILGFIFGVFVGACIVLYWEYSRNSFMTIMLSEVMKDKKQTKDNKRR